MRPRATHVWSVAVYLEAHPSLTAKAIARRVEESMYAQGRRGLIRALRLAAAWCDANWRDATAKHPSIGIFGALDALGR